MENSRKKGKRKPYNKFAEGKYQGGSIDAKTGLRHNPTNNGENDQRPSGRNAENDRSWYMTININGKSVTIDRATAYANPEGHSQPHRAWMPNAEGQWEQWSRIDEVNWKDVLSVKALNAWREQKAERLGFPKKRPHRIGPYTEEQKKWMASTPCSPLPARVRTES